MKPHFTLFGIPVWVRASFFIVTVMLGATGGTNIQSLAIWTGIVFFSVMAHELGHAFMGRAFGLAPSIQLVGMGGLTSWVGGRNVGAFRSLLISLAGPAVGLVLGTAALLLGATKEGLSPLLHQAGEDFVWVNVVWSVFNLLPMMPLDGGNAMKSVIALTKIGDAELIGRGVSLVTGGVVGFLSIWVGYFWGVILVAMYTVQNFQGIRQRLATRGDESVLRELQVDYPKWLQARDGAAMIRAGTAARAAAKTAQLQAYATEVAGMGQCLAGDPRSALATLRAMPQGYAPGPSVLLFVLEAAHEYGAAKQVLYDLLVEQDTAELRAKLTEIEEKEKRFALGRMVLSDPRAPELDADAFEAARRVADAENRHAEAAYVGSLLFDKQKDADLAFQIAREWGKAKEPAKVGEWLVVAADLGFRDVAQVDHCPDFFSMHQATPYQTGRARVAGTN